MEAGKPLPSPKLGGDPGLSLQDDLRGPPTNAPDRKPIQRTIAQNRDSESDDTSRDARHHQDQRVTGSLGRWLRIRTTKPRRANKEGRSLKPMNAG